MNNQDSKSVLLEVFTRLRFKGFSLGVGELLAAFRAVNKGWGIEGTEQLREVIQLLWCHSRDEFMDFEDIYETVINPIKSSKLLKHNRTSKTSSQSTTGEPASKPSTSSKVTGGDSKPSTQLSAFPIPTFWQPTYQEDTSAFHTYWPIARRSMIHIWRYLRQPVKDGPRNVMDIEATVNQVAQQGYFSFPIYKRHKQNHAHLVLMVDQGGSMVPFHPFTRDLVETACDKSMSKIGKVDVFYFHNIPHVPLGSVYLDRYMTEPIPVSDVLTNCFPDTGVLLVSDAGAARGHWRIDRFRVTVEFLIQLQQRTKLVAWLNPMPQYRWTDTSAQLIASFVSMFQVDTNGFRNAIDALRGFTTPNDYRVT